MQGFGYKDAIVAERHYLLCQQIVELAESLVRETERFSLSRGETRKDLMKKCRQVKTRLEGASEAVAKEFRKVVDDIEGKASLLTKWSSKTSYAVFSKWAKGELAPSKAEEWASHLGVEHPIWAILDSGNEALHDAIFLGSGGQADSEFEAANGGIRDPLEIVEPREILPGTIESRGPGLLTCRIWSDLGVGDVTAPPVRRGPGKGEFACPKVSVVIPEYKLRPIRVPRPDPRPGHVMLLSGVGWRTELNGTRTKWYGVQNWWTGTQFMWLDEAYFESLDPAVKFLKSGVELPFRQNRTTTSHAIESWGLPEGVLYNYD
jgi:hypothetical protein